MSTVKSPMPTEGELEDSFIGPLQTVYGELEGLVHRLRAYSREEERIPNREGVYEDDRNDNGPIATLEELGRLWSFARSADLSLRGLLGEVDELDSLLFRMDNTRLGAQTAGTPA